MSYKIPINLMSCLGLILSKKFSIKALWAYIIHTYTNIKLYTKYPQGGIYWTIAYKYKIINIWG